MSCKHLCICDKGVHNKRRFDWLIWSINWLIDWLIDWVSKLLSLKCLSDSCVHESSCSTMETGATVFWKLIWVGGFTGSCAECHPSLPHLSLTVEHGYRQIVIFVWSIWVGNWKAGAGCRSTGTAAGQHATLLTLQLTLIDHLVDPHWPSSWPDPCPVCWSTRWAICR